MGRIPRKLYIQAGLLILVLILAFYLAGIAQESEAVRDLVSEYGYLGIFAVSLASGFNLLVPLPAVAFMPLFLESGLSFAGSAGVMALGMSTADGLAFALGRTGRQIAVSSFGQKEALAKMEELREKYDKLPLVILFFFAALAPLPNETLLVPMALLGYKGKHLLPIVFVANIIFILGYSVLVLGVFELL